MLIFEHFESLFKKGIFSKKYLKNRCKKIWRFQGFSVYLQQFKNGLTMNYKEFTQIFLPQLASEYRDGTLPFHALVDVDLWRQVFPDFNAKPGQVQWYTVKLNAFQLNDEGENLLLTFTLPERREEKEAKFIGMRINNMAHTLRFYLLRRPSVVDEPWEIFQYNFDLKKEIFVRKMDSTDSLREFKNNIERLPDTDIVEESLFSFLKKKINPHNLLASTFS